jgi:hypothetical protein
VTARPVLAVALAVALAGCAGARGRTGDPDPAAGAARALARADEQLAAGQYRGAATLYDEFLRASPRDAEARRARATRQLLERFLASQSNVDRLQREVDRLKADLERLRSIDLRDAPATR